MLLHRGPRTAKWTSPASGTPIEISSTTSTTRWLQREQQGSGAHRRQGSTKQVFQEV